MGNTSDAIEHALYQGRNDIEYPIMQVHFDGTIESARKELFYACEMSVPMRNGFLPLGYTLVFENGNFVVKNVDTTSPEADYQTKLQQIRQFLIERYTYDRHQLSSIFKKSDSIKKLVIENSSVYLLFRREEDTDDILSLYNTENTESKKATIEHMNRWYNNLYDLIYNVFSEKDMVHILNYAQNNPYVHRLLFDPFSNHILVFLIQDLKSLENKDPDEDAQLSKLLKLLTYLPEKP